MRQFTGCAQQAVWLPKWSPSSLSSLPIHLPASPGALVLSCCLSAQDIHYFPFADEKMGLGESLLIFSQIHGDTLPSLAERLPRTIEINFQNIKILSLLALPRIKQWQIPQGEGPSHLFNFARVVEIASHPCFSLITETSISGWFAAVWMVTNFSKYTNLLFGDYNASKLVIRIYIPW